MTVNMVDVRDVSSHKTITKEAIAAPLAKFDNVVEKKKLIDESRTMPVNVVNMSQKVKVKFNSEYEMAVVFTHKDPSLMLEDLKGVLTRSAFTSAMLLGRRKELTSFFFSCPLKQVIPYL